MGQSRETEREDAARQERQPEGPAERRERLEKSLDSALEDTFPASDAINLVQPAPTTLDQRKAAGAA
jgi:hypothetical protein